MDKNSVDRIGTNRISQEILNCFGFLFPLDQVQSFSCSFLSC